MIVSERAPELPSCAVFARVASGATFTSTAFTWIVASSATARTTGFPCRNSGTCQPPR